jgi:hypothetical protein
MHTSVGVEDDRHVRVLGAHCLSDPVGIWQAELGKLLWRQVVRPAVKQLHNLRARLYLVAHVCDERCREVLQQRVQQRGVVEHDHLQQ